jgi:hypothetical protein
MPRRGNAQQPSSPEPAPFRGAVSISAIALVATLFATPASASDLSAEKKAPLPPNIRVTAATLDVHVISEDDFMRALAGARYTRPSDETWPVAADVAARVGSASRGGAALVAAPSVVALERGVFVVARVFKRDRDGTRAASDLYVVAVGGLRGTVKGITIPLAAAGRSTAPTCAPLPGPGNAPLLRTPVDARGQVNGVRIDSEHARAVDVRYGVAELRVFADAREGLPATRFACGTTVARKPIEPMPSAGKARWSLPKSAVLVSEADYLRAMGRPGLRDGGLPRVELDSDTIGSAAQIIAVANHRDAQAIEADVAGTRVDAPQFAVVVRDLSVSGTRMRGTASFVVPWPRGGIPGTKGTGLFIDFGDLLPTFDLGDIGCGPVVLPGRDPGCFEGFCTRLPKWTPMQGGYGMDRIYAGLDRTTLWWPDSGANVGGLRGRIQIIACTLFEPPLRDPPRRCDVDVFTGRPILDECNGRDDNCNGQIDEAPACMVPQSCPCQPRSCGTQTCGSIPDGCGGVVSCGGPCP